MRFLITLWWMVVAVIVALFSYRNWRDVTVDLWGPLQLDVKLPLLMLLLILLGAIPTWLVLRARYWNLSRKQSGPPLVAPVAPPPATAFPLADSREDEE